MMPPDNCYRHRFSAEDNIKRQAVWKTLCSLCFQRFIGPSDVVMDIGAGYCEFINHIRCGRKLAVDLNPDTKKYAGKDVEVVTVPATKIPSRFDRKIDRIFMSNFLEHLRSSEEVSVVLTRAHRLLSPGGKILILQPNIDLVGSHYWDFFDHNVPLNGKSLQEALELAGFSIETYIERFLPYTTKNSLPLQAQLVRWYLLLPPPLRPFAGQSFCIGKTRQLKASVWSSSA